MNEETNMDWEVFDHAGSSKSDKRPLISLQRRGSFQINHAAFKMMGEPKQVRVLYNKGRHMIGFQSAKEGERAAYRVRKAPNALTYSVAAQAFVHHYDIEVTETRRYHAKMYGDVAAIDLNSPESSPTRMPKASRPQ